MVESENEPDTSPTRGPARPQPPRPDVVVEPLRPKATAAKSPSVLFRVATAAWSVAGLLFLALAGIIAVNWKSVLGGVEMSVAEQDSTASNSEITDTATATLLSSGAAAAVLVLLAAVSLNLQRGGKPSAKFLLGAVTVLTIAASVTFSTFMAGSADLLGGVLRWGPLLAGGVAAIGTIAALAAGRR